VKHTIVGRATVVRPLRRVEIAVTRVTLEMIAVVRDFDVTVTVRLKALSVASSWSSGSAPSVDAIVDGRRRLAVDFAMGSGWASVESSSEVRDITSDDAAPALWLYVYVYLM
jgi:hypothetical protein